MKRKKLSRVLALLLAGTMIFGQPASAFASEGTDAAVEENSDSKETMEETSEPVAETNEEISEEVASTDISYVEETSEEMNGTEESSTAILGTEEETAVDQTDEDATTEEITTEETTTVDAEADIENQKILKALGFKTMNLSKEMIEEKEGLSKVVKTMSSMKADADYLENEIVYLADSKEEAERIAECYGGTLSEYEWGVAVAHIEAAVPDAVKMAADVKIGLPAVYPNIRYTISGEWNSIEASAEEDTLIDEADVVHEEVTLPEEAELNLRSDDEHLYATAPNDTYFADQWHHNRMNTVEAWNASQGDGVTVAVIDTGIDYNHPDLKDNLVGYVSTITDINGSQDTRYDGYDGNGHGTHCAGIIAATADNGVGVSGMAPKAKIYAVKALDDNGGGSTADIIQGVAAATEQNVDVISMSLGGIYWDSLFQSMIDAAVNKGIVVVAAAGNEATDQKSYPAAYNNVVSVAATDQDNDLTYFSNYGTWVDIAAPGENILSTLPLDYSGASVVVSTGYGYMSGTSMACPVVSGIVALMLGNSNELKNANTKAGVTKITKALLGSAVPDGADDYYYSAPYTYPLADAEATTYAVESGIAEIPTIVFSSEPTSKNVVLAGENEYFELKTATPHAKIYYTINGKKPTAATASLYTGRIYMETSGKIKIQAITVVGSKVSKVFSKTYTFDVKTAQITPACDQNMTVAIGKSIQLGVNFYPSYVSNKKLEWSCDDATGMIKVNKSGKVTCNKKATPDTTVTVTAKTTDGSNDGENFEYKFTVKAVADPIQSLTLNADSVKLSFWANAMDMYESGYSYSFQLTPQSGGVETKQYLYKSSNTKVAVVNSDGMIYARGKGNAKITVTANDGSGKKAVCKVTVVTPIFDIYTYSSTGFSEDSSYLPIATGCSITMKTIINYGSSSYLYTPSNKKLDWSSSDSSKVSVKNGKVTCAANAPLGEYVTITASANDKFGAATSVRFKIVDKIEKIAWRLEGKDYPSSISASFRGVGYYLPDPLRNGMFYVTTKSGSVTNVEPAFLVTVSNKDSVYRYYDSEDLLMWIITGTKPGSSKITYTARDGSNIKYTISIKVGNGK